MSIWSCAPGFSEIGGSWSIWFAPAWPQIQHTGFSARNTRRNRRYGWESSL
ncbi:hypothetical protein [Spongiactinospora gelatinilytica]|uniref:hypothetical protein n=1 Tax=Spongiactinospora gelatinilytica TaxID=2666298 RepID=UPI0013142CFB|nr:hypothetical protein [Spongiactinospora gelatinilytica]